MCGVGWGRHRPPSHTVILSDGRPWNECVFLPNGAVRGSISLFFAPFQSQVDVRYFGENFDSGPITHAYMVQTCPVEATNIWHRGLVDAG